MDNKELIYDFGYIHGRIASLNIPETDKRELADMLSEMFRRECNNDKPVRTVDVYA